MRYSACLAPAVIATCAAVHSMPFSRRSLAATASRASGVPGVATYLVMPAASARAAASLMFAGVSKSGSPVPNDTTSTPSLRIAAARAATASVALSFIRATRSETFIGNAVYRYTPPMHYDSHQPVLNDLEARITTIRDSL